MQDIEVGIMDVVRKNGIHITGRSGNSYRATCPFCEGKATMSITPSKDKFNCFLCGQKGNQVSLEYALNPSEYSGDNRYRVFLQNMAEFLRTGTQSIPNAERSFFIPKNDEETFKASDEQISSVYYAMVKLLKLNKQHEKDLLRRGLTKDQISKFRIKSAPTYQQRYTIPKMLIEMGYRLDGVPPFYKEGNTWVMKVPRSSYLCPVFDGHKNLILGFQPRLDNPIDGNKYTWMSSVGKPGGTSPGTLASVLPGKYDQAILIVEGTLKAIVTYALLNGEITVVSVPGVNSLECIRPILAEYEGKYAFEAYDMDKYTTFHEKDAKTEEELHTLQKATRIRGFADKLENMCQEYDITMHHLTWNFKQGVWTGEGKGLDDFLLTYDKRDKFIQYLIGIADPVVRMKKLIQKNPA